MTSNPFVNISIYIDKVHNDTIYDKLVKRGNEKIEDFPFETKKDLFITAACVGAKNDKFKKLSGNNHNPFSGEIFNAKVDVPILMALAYKKEKNIDVLLDPKKVIEIVQGWANGGIEILRDEILENPGRPLYNYINMVLESDTSIS